MRFKNRRTSQLRANAADRIVQTPSMARRPLTGDSHANTRLMPAVPATIPAAPKPIPDFHDPTPLPGMKALTARDGVTVVLPLVREHWTAEDATATQILPKVTEPLPPSACHVDPARVYYEQTFVEDDGMEPETRGRHVLNLLTAEDARMPDLVSHNEPVAAVQGAYGRVVAALAPPDTLAGAVRIARRAHAMFVTRHRRLDEDESRLDACWRRIDAFNADWDRELRDAEVARHGQRAVVAAEELTAAYESNRRRIAEENARRVAGGITPLDVTATTFTRGMQAKIQEMLVREAKAGSAVTR